MPHQCLLADTFSTVAGWRCRLCNHIGYSRVTVTCAGVNANAEQVRAEWAWVFLRYAPKDSPLYALERDARLGKRGLRADDGPIPPWEWRRKVR